MFKFTWMNVALPVTVISCVNCIVLVQCHVCSERELYTHIVMFEVSTLPGFILNVFTFGNVCSSQIILGIPMPSGRTLCFSCLVLCQILRPVSFFFLTFDKFIGTYEAQTLCGGLLYTDQP